jgi:hypothetical protein
MRRLYISPNGDRWFLARDAGTGFAFIRHEANIPLGGQVTDTPLGVFLSLPQDPEHEALLRLIGTLVPAAQRGHPGNPTGRGVGEQGAPVHRRSGRARSRRKRQ